MQFVQKVSGWHHSTWIDEPYNDKNIFLLYDFKKLLN